MKGETSVQHVPLAPERFFVVGGAGFIGSHFVDVLLADRRTKAVTVYDNLSSGREWHYQHHQSDGRFRVVRADVCDTSVLAESMSAHDVVIHLASNPDIARAMTEPSIDFDQGTVLTHHVVEAMRTVGTKRILYASGSGVYGDLGATEAREDHGPAHPISTYGASKLAGEALICSYCHMFGLRACVFRFGNVVGPRQTHGVAYDFILRLRQDSTKLRVLGDGRQSKSYVHVGDVVRAVLLAHAKTHVPFRAYNVAAGDCVTVQEIADLAIACSGLSPQDVSLVYSGGDRGWKGDVPVVRLNTDRIRGLGWECQRSSREALRASILSMLGDERVVAERVA